MEVVKFTAHFGLSGFGDLIFKVIAWSSVLRHRGRIIIALKGYVWEQKDYLEFSCNVFFLNLAMSYSSESPFS